MDEQSSWRVLDVVDKLYDSMRSYRKERCAIFIDPDSAEGFIRESALQTDFLNPDENAHWTGVQRKAHPKLKRIITGDYDEWFRWFMKWQRFNAFHIVVLVAPIRRMVEDDRRGYFDGLLTRLLTKQSVHRVVVVEQERFHPVLRKWLGNESIIEESTELRNKFGREQFVDAISSLLYGTLLSKRNLTTAAASTLFAKLNPAWEAGLQDVKLRPSLVERSHKWLYTTGYYGKEKVESL